MSSSIFLSMIFRPSSFALAFPCQRWNNIVLQQQLHRRPSLKRHTSFSFVRYATTSSSTRDATAPSDPPFSMRLIIPTVEDMEEVGAVLSVYSSPPDTLFLDGDLGAGKTAFARGFIHCKLGIPEDDDSAVRVTSPTYLLSNTYAYSSSEATMDDTNGNSNKNGVQEIHHIDLYRLSGQSVEDFSPLNLDHVFSKHISLIEWPSRLLLAREPQLLPNPTHRLNVDVTILPGSECRMMTLSTMAGSSSSSWIDRLKELTTEGIFDDLLPPTGQER